MNFLKNLFGGGSSPKDKGIYVYVRLNRSGEIVRLRLQPGYDVSLGDGDNPISRKQVVGPRTFERAEATLLFDKNYRLVDAEIDGGELADEAAWNAQQAQN